MTIELQVFNIFKLQNLMEFKRSMYKLEKLTQKFKTWNTILIVLMESSDI